MPSRHKPLLSRVPALVGSIRRKETTTGSSPVLLDNPEHMNLLGLLMKGLLETNLADPAFRAWIRPLVGDVLVQAGEMKVILRFADGQVRILPDGTGDVRSSVAGDMAALLGVVADGRMVLPFLGRRIRIGGDPLFLMRILPLIRSQG